MGRSDNQSPSDDQSPNSSSTPTSDEKPKKKRGATRLPLLVSENDPNKKKKIHLNDEGVPKVHKQEDFPSYTALMARKLIPIDKKDWHAVDDADKERLWKCILSRFEIDVNLKKQILQGCGVSWRNFKSTLFTKYILKNLDEPEIFEKPPEIYPFIKQNHWDAFVESRLTEQFMKLHNEQSERRSHNTYNHRSGRSGYIGLEEKLIKEGKYTPEQIDRGLLWIEARLNKDGEFEDDATKEKAEQIREFQKDHEDGDKSNDALAKAFGPERPGRVRAGGKYAVPTRYFGRPKTEKRVTRAQLDACLEENQQLKQTNEELVATNVELTGRVGNLEKMFVEFQNSNKQSAASRASLTVPTLSESSRSPNPKKKSFAGQDKVDALIHKKNKTTTTSIQSTSLLSKGPGYNINKYSRLKMTSQPAVNTLSKDSGLGTGESCKLMVNSRIVAIGNVFPTTEEDMVEDTKAGKDNYRVQVEFAKMYSARLRVPIRDEIVTVGQAIGKIVLWPKNSIVRDTKVGDTASSADPLTKFYDRMSTFIQQSQEDFHVSMGTAIFNTRTPTSLYLSVDDFSYICHRNLQASMNNVAFYIRYLHEKIILEGKENKFGFINPATFPLNSGTSETLLNELRTCLINSNSEFVFVPYLKNNHWVLMVVKLSIPKIWWLDSIGGGPKDNIDEVIKSAVKDATAEGIRPSWYSPPLVPKQPGGWECGFYVMRFMKEIIEEQQNPITGILNFRKRTYDDNDIMEVKREWISYFEKEMMEDI